MSKNKPSLSAPKRAPRGKSQPPKKKRKSTKKKGGFSFLIIIKWLFVLGLWCSIFLVGVLAWYAKDLPSITKNATFERKRSIIVEDREGNIVTRYGDIIGNQVTIDDIPPYLVQAVISIEDRRFYYHAGIDPLGLARAMLVNTTKGRVVQGGSTITQQLAKNLFLSRERTYKRKIQEALLAFWLEYELSKDEIMAAYLNRVYLGSGTYGVDAAAKLYFDSPVKDISLRESAQIAALLKAPSRYSPDHNPELSRQRANLVLNAMKEEGYITQAQIDNQESVPPKPTDKPQNEMAERFYTDWIVDTLEDLIGTPDEDLIVKTTMNPEIQNFAVSAVHNSIEENGEAKQFSEGAMVVMRPNGEVVALVGGGNYSKSQFNRATQAVRTPGSSFKPIVYLTALEAGWSPYDRIMDEPITESRYRPKNFGNKYYGEVTLEEALTLSLNTVAVNLMKSTGPQAVIDSAQRLGITSKLEPDLSLALGSSGVTLLEMATVYSVLANGGLQIEPFGITEIRSKETGEVYYQRAKTQRFQRVFNERDIGNITQMMSSVMRYGTGRGASFGVPASGKTGTSNDSRDALFIGFTRELIGAVWLGNDDNSSMKNVTGGSFPARIWREVMSKSQGRYPGVRRPSAEPPPPFSSRSSFQNMIKNLFPGNDSSNQERGNIEPQAERKNQRQRQIQRQPQPTQDDRRPITQDRYDQRFND
ncbi:MAG: penicillin-binding protein [Micavibrio sp.]|nr:penicillin-binding protein [Micavibrio sp.]